MKIDRDVDEDVGKTVGFIFIRI